MNLHELGGGGSFSESYNLLQEILATSSKDQHLQAALFDQSMSMAEAKAVAANKSHSEAERRRRKRINGHLATLRNLVPKTIKADKASLLAEVVRCIRELKKTTQEFSSSSSSSSGADDTSSSSTTILMDQLLFPGETDELQIWHDHSNPGIIKASLCCEDRPQMMTELTKALKQTAAIIQVVRAEMATVGGRTKTVLWLQVSAEDEGMVLATIRKAIKGVLDNRMNNNNNNKPEGGGLILGGQSLLGNKRPRPYHA
ncbi:OLC1v1011687C1 [Oldenlandia corymbosa var. corymbosa]|uniref:OLC1v1011687C1 n=1 Tax=Oldenlandia corymbosa var. corymbosa TaxID=529605 RepID=A0AAV1DUA8_OLDCO|nr:OLC1v1011687C1 [Oldenlandia corymbosa var. corymbosa]